MASTSKKVKPGALVASDCIIDAHMHIMSGHCTPLPVLWHQPGFSKAIASGVDRDGVDNAGRLLLKRENVPVDKDEFLRHAVQNVLMLSPPGRVIVIADLTINVITEAAISRVQGEDTKGLLKRAVLDEVGGLLSIGLGRDPQEKSVQERATADIGDVVARANAQTFATSGKIAQSPVHRQHYQDVWRGTPPEGTAQDFQSLFAPMIVMPMDMDYAHLTGFYRDASKPNGIPFAIYIKRAGFVYRRVCNRSEPRKPTEIKTPEENLDKYQWYLSQRVATRVAAGRNPWSLLPMFHYDPRRWSYKGEELRNSEYHVGSWDAPFGMLASRTEKSDKEKAGLYLGFKVYTPLGYGPAGFQDANRVELLPDMAKFYQECIKHDVPVLNHCSMGGVVSHDYEEYLDLEHDRQSTKAADLRMAIELEHQITAKLKPAFVRIFNSPNTIEVMTGQEGLRIIEEVCRKNPKATQAVLRLDDKSPGLDAAATAKAVSAFYRKHKSDSLREGLFREKLVSPENWKELLSKNGLEKLKVCLAHFGGDRWKAGTSDAWVQSIISLIDPQGLGKTYPNVYTDISCFASDPLTVTLSPNKARRNFLEFLSKNKNSGMMDRIMFGTDWYMTLISSAIGGVNKQYREQCEGIHKLILEADSTGILWVKFTLINPARFYGFSGDKSAALIGNLYAALSKICLPGKEDVLERGYIRMKSLAKEIKSLEDRIAVIGSFGSNDALC